MEYDELKKFLSKKFPDSSIVQQHYLELLQSYISSGLSEEKSLSEIFASCNPECEGKFWEIVWEAMIYRHISNLGYSFGKPIKSGKNKLGPDFCFFYNEKKIWIEATLLNLGQNFSKSWFEAKEGQARSMPYEEMLLRWTSALKAKKEQIDKWINGGILTGKDPCVIAVNSSQLSWWPSEDRGISQLPWAVEACYPVGPLQVSSNGKIKHSTRLSIKKKSSKAEVRVRTAIFLDPEYSKISAVIGCARDHMLCKSKNAKGENGFEERGYLNDEYFFTVVHNPLAKNPCLQKIFGNFVEYVMKEEEDSWAITRI